MKDAKVGFDPRFTHLVSARGVSLLVGAEEPVVLEIPHAKGAPPEDLTRLIRAVIPLIDGTRTRHQLAAAVGDELELRSNVHFLLDGLERAGLLRERPEETTQVPPTLDASATTLFRHWRSRDNAAACEVPLSRLRRRAPDDWVLLLTDDYLSRELRAAVDRLRARSAKVLLARVAGPAVWLGPALGPGHACVECLQTRLRVNLQADALVHVPDAAVDEVLWVQRLPTPPPLASFARLSAGLGAFVSRPEALLDALTVLSPDGQPQAHHVRRLPQCGACGDPSLEIPGPDVELGSQWRVGASAGGFRIVDPEVTLERYSSLISPLTGVVRYLRKRQVPGTDLVHVYTASHAHHYGHPSLRGVLDDRRDHSGGKGRTDLDARVSALCESLERFSSVWRGNEPTRTARFSDLPVPGYAPNELALFSPGQFAGRHTWNATHRRGFQRVCEPYDDEAIAWSPVAHLETASQRLVPAAFLYDGFAGPGSAFCDADSNGLAGGNCLEEAVLQGFLELVERDAVALWWYNRARRPAVDLESLDDPWVLAVRAYFDTLARELWVLDLTTDLEIPTFAALSARNNGASDEIIFGFGAHFDAEIALNRALTEVNQMLPTVLDPPELRRQRLLPEFGEALEWWETARCSDHAYLLPDPESSPVPPPVRRIDESMDLREIVGECISAAHHVGCEVLVHDLTRPDVGYHVVKVIVPGLRHFWRRTAPGRLYETPVRLGWIDGATEESDLNPTSLFV